MTQWRDEALRIAWQAGNEKLLDLIQTTAERLQRLETRVDKLDAGHNGDREAHAALGGLHVEKEPRDPVTLGTCEHGTPLRKLCDRCGGESK